MAWTHLYDLLLKLATLFAFIGLGVLLPVGDGEVGWVVLTALVLYFIIYNRYVRTLSTWLYCRLTLRMDLTITQARTLNDAFTPAWPMQREWLPMKDLKKYSEGSKYGAALLRYDSWRQTHSVEQEKKKEDFRNLSSGMKWMTYATLAAMLYLFVATIAEWPPATYVIQAYCTFFETDRYPVMGIWLIMVVVPLVLVALVGRSWKKGNS